ncbi:NLR family, CARD domain containing 5 isoform X3 [Carcharodon carcharias]|uniref:NLR family, CARD domain containing 5 isoform X3 n=1 Tax=Carcharodon carcharias TaxID=13397 RepID=UPI001B7F51F6|nr:NLR family, CARD domain containing 5 isoform X3 [Carcharodon carcharias]
MQVQITGMSTGGIKEVLESNHGHLVECLSLEADHVLEEAKGILSEEELNLVMSQGTNVEKVSLLLNKLMTKDNDTCKKFIETVIIIMPCNSFPMCLENMLMTAGDNETEGLLHQQQNESNSDNTQVESSVTDAGRKRKAAQVANPKPTEVKRSRKGNHCKAAAVKSSSVATFTSTLLNPNLLEMDSTSFQTGEEYLNLPAISDSAEDYKSLMIKTISQKYEANIAKADEMKQVILDQTFRSLTMKDGNVAKLKERIDASRDDVFSSPGLEESQDSVANLAEFLNRKHVSNCRVHILLGKAGTGKTKLMHKICYEWTQGAVCQFQYIFLFEFRQLNLIKKSIDLKSMLFDLFLQPERNSHSVFRFIVRNPEKILILFDGFDEFAGKASVHTSAVSSDPIAPLSVGQLFSSLCHGKLLPGCTILITSRPKDILCLPLDVVGQVGEVSGFNQCKIEEYASRFFKNSEHNRQATCHLQKNRKVLNTCSIPAMCWVVFLCLEHLLSQNCLEPKLPHTMTQFYIKMLTVFLRKGTNTKVANVNTENQLLNKHREEIQGLCNLARKGLQESKSVFYLRDLLSEKVTHFASSYGFLTTFEVKTIDQNQENGHAFVHLTLQEFLAALHQMIDSTITDQMLKRRFYLKSKWTSKNDVRNEFTDAVHIFLSGLASKGCKQFLSILSSKNEEWVQKKQKAILQNLQKLATTNLTGPKIIELCHCVYETQDCDLAREVAAHLKSKFELRNFRLTPVDMTVLTFVINSGACCICLDIGGCAMDLETVAVLGTCKNIEIFVFKSRKYEDKFAGTLSEIIPKVNSLKKLILTSCSISMKGAVHLSSALKICHHLEEINLQDNELGDAGIAVLVDALPQMGSLRKIELGGNNITVDGILNIANAISTCPNIMHIQVSDSGNIATVQFFTGSTITPINRSSGSLSPLMECEGNHEALLRKLSLVNCKLAAQHVQALCRILQCCPQLASLDLSGNELKDHGLRRFIEILPDFHISKLINLSNNGISKDGVLCLASVLKKCPKVFEIEVSLIHPQTVLLKLAEWQEDTELRDERKSPLVDFRLSYTGDSKIVPAPLRKLSLTNCCFQLEHLEELGSTLENCNDVAELDLSNNSLGEMGIKKLVELLPKLHVSKQINISNNFSSLAGVLCLAGCLNRFKDITEVTISLGKSGKGLIKFHEKYRFQQEQEFEEPSEILSFGTKYGYKDLCVPKKFRLEECEMDGETMRNLCLILEQCSGLTEFDLSNNALSDEVIAELLNHLPDLHDLKILNITDNIISPDAILLLANSLNICENVLEVEVRASGRASISLMKKAYRLEDNGKKTKPPCSRILSLKECNLGKRSVEKLFGILECCKDLTELDLSCNLLGDEELQCLRDFLPKLHVLKLIDVSNNRISPAAALYLVESLNTCSSVVEVEVSLSSHGRSLIKFAKRCENKVCSVKECRFKEEELLKFFSIIEWCSHLTELNLAGNMMGDEGLRNLVEVVTNLKDLKELNLQRNGVSLVAVKGLLIALKDCPKALMVRFEEPWIYDEDAANLVQCACSHLNIADIGIKNNNVLIRLVDYGWQSAEMLRSNYDSTRMDTGAQNSSLRLISLYQCGIEAPQLLHLAPIVKQCPHLLEFHLYRNSIGNKGAETLAEILPAFQGLKKLSLESVDISSNGMVKLAAGLRKCHSIEEINLSQNELGLEGVSELGKTLPGLKQLKKINLSRISTAAGLVGTNMLAEGLRDCTRLEEINLDSLMLKDSGAQLLAEGILRMPCLKKLNLRCNSIGCKGAMHLANGLKCSTAIVEIDLYGNCIEDVGALKLADIVPNMKSLKMLNLTQNSITAAGGEGLAQALTQCPSVEEIHLSINKIGDQTAKKLAEALSKLPCLKILNLHSSELTADGGGSLARGLMLCPSIEVISLPENRIGNKGVMDLAMALRKMTSLKKLDLQLTRFDDSVAEDLAAGLVCCPNIEEVILSWNNISDESAVRLADALPRMRGLKKLDLEGNKITAAGAEKLAASLRQCSFIEVIRLWKNKISKDREQSLHEQDSRLNFLPV